MNSWCPATMPSSLNRSCREQAEAEGDPDRKVSIKVRSVLTCEARSGVCAHCYGMNMAFGEPVGRVRPLASSQPSLSANRAPS